WELTGGRFRPAAAAVAVMAAAPLFVGLSHYYFVEMMQTAAVGWFILLAAVAPRWSRSLTVSHLLLASAVAMLAKASSPLYCFAPGLAAGYAALRANPNREPRRAATPAVPPSAAVRTIPPLARSSAHRS